MRKYIFISLLLCYASTLFAQTTFSSEDDKKVLHKGDVVTIKADTAYLYSTARVKKIKNRLDTISEMYNTVLDSRNELLDEMKETHKLLGQLQEKMESDSTFMNSELDLILAGFETQLEYLEKANKDFKTQNEDLERQTKHLKQLVNDLKSELKGIWWNGVTDKIVAFVGGVGVGILIGVLL